MSENDYQNIQHTGDLKKKLVLSALFLFFLFGSSSAPTGASGNLSEHCVLWAVKESLPDSARG